MLSRLLHARKEKRFQIGFNEKSSVEDIYYCFRLILGRNPNLEEMEGHFLNVGCDLKTTVANYLMSDEFKNRKMLDAQPDRQYVRVKTDGIEMIASPEDEDVGKYVIRGNYESHVTALFKRHVLPGMHVLDIGANIGYFSMLAAKLVGDSGSVVAVEPNPANGRLIELSRQSNDFKHLRLLQVAASDHVGTLMLESVYSNGITRKVNVDIEHINRLTTIPCFTLDDLLPDYKVDFLKIDVEGAEYCALKGAERLLLKNRPIIVTEFSPKLLPEISGVDGVGYLSYLVKLGYTLAVVQDDTRVIECGACIDTVINAYEASGINHIDLLCTPINH